MKRRPKALPERLEALHRNIRLLRCYHQQAFEERDSDYLGEVAGKLRLLIYKSPTCHPLLVDLMSELSIAVRLDVSGPGNRSADLGEYFEVPCGMFTSPRTGQSIEVTRMQLVSRWANQIGASHEDPGIQPEFEDFLSQPFFVNETQIAVEQLRLSSKFVLAVYNAFQLELDKQRNVA